MPRRYYHFDGYAVHSGRRRSRSTTFITVVALMVGAAQLLVHLQPRVELLARPVGRRQPLARRLARMADARDAAGPWQLGRRSCRWCTAGPTPTVPTAGRRRRPEPPRRIGGIEPRPPGHAGQGWLPSTRTAAAKGARTRSPRGKEVVHERRASAPRRRCPAWPPADRAARGRAACPASACGSSWAWRLRCSCSSPGPM